MSQRKGDSVCGPGLDSHLQICYCNILTGASSLQLTQRQWLAVCVRVLCVCVVCVCVRQWGVMRSWIIISHIYNQA